ncbi:MAG: translation elongation factor Ts [Candidatus Cloacimonadota bacterium]|nr:translation elongation factor Ts [Candidatus Cloacimonadota bacterium]
MKITAKDVKELRDKTNVGLMDCKKALQETDGDIAKAVDLLRKRGIAKAEKKALRDAADGIIYSYIHAGAKLGVLLELSCETDFVARNEKFVEMAKKIAMHIAATDPIGITHTDVDPALIEKEKEIYRAQGLNSGKPDNIVEKIVEGRLKKFFKENCLLDQPLIMDEDITIDQLLKDAINTFGENIKINRFSRYEIGR